MKVLSTKVPDELSDAFEAICDRMASEVDGRITKSWMLRQLIQRYLEEQEKGEA